MIRFLVAILVGFFTVNSANGSILNTIDRGWYNNDGSHSVANDNYIVGQLATTNFRNFFVWDLSSVSGPITSASVKLWNPTDGNNSPVPTTYEFFDVSTSIASIIAGTGDVGAYNDFGTGTSLGTAVVSSANNGSLVTINLNSAGIAAANAAIGGQFAIGGALNSNVSHMFAFSGSNNPNDGLTYLEFQTQTIPEPGSFLVWGMLGLASVGLTKRRRRIA